MNREAIFSALWALNEGLQFNMNSGDGPPAMSGWKLRERKLKLFSDVPSAQKPYIAQVEHNEDFVKVRNMPYRVTLGAQWFIYQDNAKIPAIINNRILDAVQACLAPKPIDPGFFDNRNTLSGLVYDCYIEGEVFKDPGDIDNQGMMVVPIKLLVP